MCLEFWSPYEPSLPHMLLREELLGVIFLHPKKNTESSCIFIWVSSSASWCLGPWRLSELKGAQPILFVKKNGVAIVLSYILRCFDQHILDFCRYFTIGSGVLAFFPYKYVYIYICIFPRWLNMDKSEGSLDLHSLIPKSPVAWDTHINGLWFR